MKSALLKRIAFCILLALLPVSGSLAAAGKFNFVIGDVRVAGATGERKAEKGNEVEAGETIVSGKDGIAQLRMSDGAFIAVRADTALRIDQYQFSGKADASSASVLSLVKGTFRAFTGAIASFNKDKFVMKTPGATIGIRGSGNVLNFTPDNATPDNGITLNHTIEGSHTITAKDPSGAMRTLVTLPGQTVQVNPTGEMRLVPTPAFILNAATGASEPKMKQQKEQSQQQNTDKQNADNKGDDKKGADKQGGAPGPAGKPGPAAGMAPGMAPGMVPGAEGMPGMPPGGMATDPALGGMAPPPPGTMPPPPPPGTMPPPPPPGMMPPPPPPGMMPPPPPGMMPPPPLYIPPPYTPPPYIPPTTNPPP